MNQPTVNPFIRLSCGCIGMVIGRPDEYLCIKRCDKPDYHDPEIDLFVRKLDPEKHAKGRELTSTEVERLLANLSSMIHLGYRYLELVRLIQAKTPEIQDVLDVEQAVILADDALGTTHLRTTGQPLQSGQDSD